MRWDVVGDHVHPEAVPNGRGQQFRRQLQLHLVLIHADLDEDLQRQARRTHRRRDRRRPLIEEPTGGPERLHHAREDRRSCSRGRSRCSARPRSRLSRTSRLRRPPASLQPRRAEWRAARETQSRTLVNEVRSDLKITTAIQRLLLIHPFWTNKEAEGFTSAPLPSGIKCIRNLV